MSIASNESGRALPIRRVGRLLVWGSRAVAFWTAILLPFLYVPLLVGGLTGQELLVFGGLLVVNVVALVAGHDYARRGT